MGFVINDAMMIHIYELKKIAGDRFFFPPRGESIWSNARGTRSFFQDSIIVWAYEKCLGCDIQSKLEICG